MKRFIRKKKKTESKPTLDFDNTDKKNPMRSLFNLILNTAKLSLSEVSKSIENDLSYSTKETYFVYISGDFFPRKHYEMPMHFTKPFFLLVIRKN